MNWTTAISILNTASAVVIAIGAVYLAKFEYRLVEKLKKEFYPLPLLPDDYPFTRREAGVHMQRMLAIELDDRDQWAEINRIRDSIPRRP